MAIVTGDRYLDLLARFVEEHAGALLDSTLVLKLNPVGLLYVQTRLEALRELERLRTGAPVDYLRSYISDLGDHRALEQLSRVLRLLPAVKVVSLLPPSARDPTPISLLPFGRLKSLELRGCDLSTSAARGLLELRPCLENLICINSADALRHIFAERTVEIQDAQIWSRLTSVSCAFNGMLLMDESLQLLPAVQFLDLSRNRFANAANLQRCSKLRYLDLGFNQLRTISSFSQVKAKITKLVLRNNALMTLCGIESLIALEAVDLSHNMVSNFDEVELLSALPSLESLWLEGNPIAFTTYYREEVLSFFPDPSKVHLDGTKISRSENWNISFIIPKRHEKRAGHGLYAPAENVVSLQTGMPASVGDDDLTHTTMHIFNLPSRAKRKVSRLASIQDAKKSLETKRGEQNDSSGLHMSSSYHGDVDDRKTDAVDVVDQGRDVEALRGQGSNFWLQELKSLLEKSNGLPGQHVPELALGSKKPMTSQQMRKIRERWSRRWQKLQQKSAKESSNMGKKGEGLDLETDDDEDESLMNMEKHDDFDGSSEISEAVNSTEESSFCGDVGSSELMTSFGFSVNSQLPHDLGKKSAPKSGRTTSSLRGTNGSLTAEEFVQSGFGNSADEEQTSVDESFGSFRVIDEMVELCATPRCPVSPPHYHEDVLHKRQNLEEELLRSAFDSGYGPPSSDSETSNDDSPVNLSTGSSSEGSLKPYREGLESIVSRTVAKPWQEHKEITEHFVKGVLTNAPFDGCDDPTTTSGESKCNGEPKFPTEEHSSVTHWPNIREEKATEALRTSHLDPACTDDILANAGGGDVTQLSTENSAPKHKVKGKGKGVRRVVVFEQDFSGHDLQCEDEFKGKNMGSRSVNVRNLGQESACVSGQEFLSVDVLPCWNMVSPGAMIENNLNILSEEPGNNVPLFTDGSQDQCTGNGRLKDPVEEFFRMKIGNHEELECCLHYLKCGCVRLWEESPKEREILLMISNVDMLYMLVESTKYSHVHSQADTILSVLASHKLRDVKKVMVGLGLQALRFDIGHSASYLFVTRDVNASREILDWLRRPIKGNNEAEFSLESWEQVQLKMFEKYVLGGVRTDIRMYGMWFFCYGCTSEDNWSARSIFLTSHHIFVCMEDILHFGISAEDSTTLQKPYFTIEAWGSISDLVEVVAGPIDGGYVTLSFQKVSTRTYFSSDLSSAKIEARAGDFGSLCIWTFKGLPEGSISKLVSLLRANHMDQSRSPLFVKSV